MLSVMRNDRVSTKTQTWVIQRPIWRDLGMLAS